MGRIFGVITLIIFMSGLKAASSPVLAIDLTTAITPVSVEIVSHGLDAARDRNASLVILRLDTPGGLMDSMREIIQRILASPVPVVAWVGPGGARAASAGFFLLQASDIAAMGPGTNTGAAHPVSSNGQMDPVMKQKVENDAAALMRSLTTRRSRNSALAEQTVVASKSFTEREALDGHLIEIVAASERDLLKQLDGRVILRFNGATQTLHTAETEIVRYNESVRERILTFLSDPNVALIFLMLGALGIYAEFNAPGAVFPGVAGSICALLALSALSVLPISTLGASLIALAFLFFGLELKFASHGILGIGGAAALTLGSLLLIDSPLPEMRIHLVTALAVALPFAVITAFLFSIAARARANKSVSGPAGMIGEIGTTVEVLNPAGRIFVHGEYWNAASSATIQAGTPARVVAVNGLQLSVEPVGDKIGSK
jgi:membrane-bound serine protease (ClpP class)